MNQSVVAISNPWLNGRSTAPESLSCMTTLVIENPLHAMHQSIQIAVERNDRGFWTASFHTPVSWCRIERDTAVAAFAASKAFIDLHLADEPDFV
jgi:hypothetical protein